MTSLGYCNCDEVAKLTDPNGHVTAWSYDLQGRPIAKLYADGTKTTLAYEQAISRLQGITDALGQVTSYTYNYDDTLEAISYAHAIHPTPPVSFTWDPAFLRLLNMTDGTGKTTYAYYPVASPPVLGAAMLKSITGPNAGATYTYDKLGRAVTASLKGAVSQVSFDALGRVTSKSSPLDTFTISYLGATDSPLSIRSAKGLSSLYTYFDNLGDERLKAIVNSKGGSAISGFQYAYDDDDEVTSAVIQKQLGGTVTRTMSYDSAGQLLGLAPSGGGNSYAFAYDPGSNRISEQAGSSTTSFHYNSVNELTSSNPATYDKDGEPLVLGNESFQWDAAGRLIAAVQGGNSTTFAYDGLGRRVRITQLSGKKIVSDKRYFWCGGAPCLETDAADNNAVTKRYFDEGVVAGGQPLYYAQDNLGSVHELVDRAGSAQASYDYDPYGVRTKLAGSKDSDFSFAGLFHESQSGLDLAMYRAYDAPLGRWLNRDPIGEAEGANLYAYAFNSPGEFADVDGLAPQIIQYRTKSPLFATHDVWGIEDETGAIHYFDFYPTQSGLWQRLFGTVPGVVRDLSKPYFDVGKNQETAQYLKRNIEAGYSGYTDNFTTKIVSTQRVSPSEASRIIRTFQYNADKKTKSGFNVLTTNCRLVPRAVIAAAGVFYIGNPLTDLQWGFGPTPGLTNWLTPEGEKSPLFQ